jgi:hypothetical protein
MSTLLSTRAARILATRNSDVSSTLCDQSECSSRHDAMCCVPVGIKDEASQAIAGHRYGTQESCP